MAISVAYVPNVHRVRQVFVPNLVGMVVLMQLNVAPCSRPRLLHLDRRQLVGVLWLIVVMEIDMLDIVRLMLLPDNKPSGVLFFPIE